MRFGVHYLTSYLPELDGTVPQFYQHIFEQVREAEQLGFDDAWVTEHHFHHAGGLIPHPPVFLTALAARTTRIHLGVAISVLPLHNPLLNAEAYAMVDLLSNGRLEFGIGRGATPQEFAGFGFDYGDSAARLKEHAEVLVQAWSDEPVTYQGQIFAYAGTNVLPKPLQRHWVGVYRDALHAHGHDPARREVLGKFHAYVGESDAAARREAEPYWLNYHRLTFDRGSWTQNHVPGLEDYAEQIEARHVIVGDAARCTELIHFYKEALGLTALSLQFHFGGMPQEQTLHSLRRFAERVMPAFAASSSSGAAAVARMGG